MKGLITLIAALIALPAHADWTHDTYELFEGTTHRVSLGIYVSLVCFPSGDTELIVGMTQEMWMQLKEPKPRDVVTVSYRVDEREAHSQDGLVVSFVNSSLADAVSITLLPQTQFVADAKAGTLLRLRLERGGREYLHNFSLIGFTAAYERMPSRCTTGVQP
jgi:hypothetical protein